MKVGFFERPLVNYCEVMRKQRVQNLSAIEIFRGGASRFYVTIGLP